MKKYIIASIVGMGIISGTSTACISVAHAANNNEVTFLGAVNAQTCNLSTSVNGTAQPNQVVQLGTVQVGQTSSPVIFAMTPTNPTDPGCVVMKTKTITVSWASSALNTTGFGATSGTATDAVVLVNSVNAKKSGAVNANASTVEFDGAKLATEGLKFNASLKGGTIEGNFKSVASFAVAYK
ncbi:fimbrial protein [Escherichia coli]|uniref:fimbrial protein n=1 Tax=Escherichia coli TaxID=562 RepID=UPI001355ECDE|nr:fimbrial protein [Escherichia coli]MWM72152.1 fimbrial protein [Escherichia coli]